MVKKNSIIYALYINSSNLYSIRCGEVLKLTPRYTDGDVTRYLLSIKWSNGTYSSIQDNQVYETRKLAEDAMYRANYGY